MQNNIDTLPRMADGSIRYPRGWFIIGGSEDYPQGEVKPIKYFGREMVAFRGESGQMIVLDAYCPHMGAHLGHGGKVEGDTVRCPFHAWRFDASGQCVEIPYAKKIPERGCTRSWETREISGLVFIWHDPQGQAPDYEIPAMDEFGKEGWTGWNLNRLEIKTHPREIIENVADSAHFIYVHQVLELFDFQNIFDGHTVTQLMHGRGVSGELKTRATYYGPAFQYTWMSSIVESRLVNTNTPVDENTVHLWFGVMIQVGDFTDDDIAKVNASLESVGLKDQFELTPDNLLMVQEAIIASTRQGYYDDVKIWEHKLYRTDPVLCDGDGPLNKLRKWYQQFYRDR
ncbi:MAG TPA: Rieske 2Fe-2S domain-containing protein [Pseudomonadales bacterium]